MTSHRCLVLRCGDPDASVMNVYGRFSDWFARALAPWAEVVVRDVRTEPVDASWLDDTDAVVVTGSAHAVYETHPWLPPLEALVREAVEKRARPFLGVCFGHQLLARSLGGTVTRNPRGREMGTIEVCLHEAGVSDPLFHGFPRSFRAQATHRDSVVAPPPGARVLAWSALDDCQAFAFGARAWGVQFHPEFSGSVLRAYVRSRRDELAREGFDPDGLHDSIDEVTRGSAVLENFAALAFGCGEPVSEPATVGPFTPHA